MILLFIFGISLIQFALYYFNRKYKTKLHSIIILFGILANYYFILPELFYPEPKIIRINCGLPILGVNLAFWIFGTIAALGIHIVWVLWKLKREST